MEVSGHRELRNMLSSTLRFGSEEDTGLYCHPCDLNGQRVTASGYCQNCREHLCDQCIASHKKATPSREHAVVSIPATAVTAVSSDKLPNCTTHKNEEVKLYCRAHGILGCVICMTLSHKLCEIDYIPEVSEQFLKSEEYATFQNSLYNLKEKCALNISKIEAGISSIEGTYSDTIYAVKQTKQEIIDSLDKFQKELEETVAEYRKKNIETMESLKREYESLVGEIVETESAAIRMNADKRYNSLFFEVKNAMSKVADYQSRSYELCTRYCTQECIFEKSQGLSKYLTKENMFGSIEITNTELGPCNWPEQVIDQPIGHINMKAEDDKKTCYVTGMVFLSADQLAVADRENRNVKIVDVTYDKMISKIALSSSPRDITVIPPDTLAVTLRDVKIIQLLSTVSGLSKLEQIKTSEKCRGIEYYDGKLIVCFDSLLSEVQILNLKGQILCRFVQDKVVEPKCLALSPNLNHIYVTDFMEMRILRLTQTGNITAVHKSVSFLMGIAVSSGGSVYVCAKNNDQVLQCSDDLSDNKVVLNANDGIKGPIGLAYSKARNALYISCGKGGEKMCDKLHAFKIK